MSKNIPIKLLQSGDTIPILGLGTWNLRGKECTSVVKKAIDLGYRHIDTAEMYQNEEAIGKAIKGLDRSQLFITSKVWYTHLRHNDIIKACNQSLKKLGTSYLDLYLIHWPVNTVPFEETFSALVELYDGGLIKNIGVSNFTQFQIKRALQYCSVPIITNQVEFHPYLYQKDLLEFCGKYNILITAWSPLIKGAVFNDSTLKKIAKNHDRTAAQIALRWLVQKDIIVIPKTRSEARLKENMDLFDWELSEEEVAAIDAIPTQKRLIDLSLS